jgi:hypothetical protein
MSTGQALKGENGFFDLRAFLAHFSKHLQDVHAGRIAQPREQIDPAEDASLYF